MLYNFSVFYGLKKAERMPGQADIGKRVGMIIVDSIKNILKRGAQSAKYKFSMIIGMIAMVHVCLVALFAIMGIVPMTLLNIGSVLLYLTCLWAIRHDRDQRRVFYATYLEIIVQSFAATLCIGWRFGFPQYVIALVPFGYYMCHTLIGNRRKYVIATVLGAAALVSFVSCRILSMFFGPLYHPEVSEGMVLGIYIFNTLCNFGFLFIVTVIFLVEMQTATNQLQKQNEILDTMAHIDPLTELYNRRSMHAFLNEVQDVRENEPFCLIMCDIDDFKGINDTYGHDTGDNVLREIARIVQSQVEKYGRACRWGGEEMLLLIYGDLEQARRIAENIRREVNGFGFCLGGQSMHCSITIGVAMHQEGDRIDHTITHADNNLYYGKRNGKNRVVSDMELKTG